MRRVLLYGCASVAVGVVLALPSAVLLAVLGLRWPQAMAAAALIGLLLATLSFVSLILDPVNE